MAFSTFVRLAILVHCAALGACTTATGDLFSRPAQGGSRGATCQNVAPVSLADAIRSLSSDPLTRLCLGEAGRHRFLSHFTIDSFARQSEAFYRSVISHWHGVRFGETSGLLPSTAHEAA